MKRFIPLLLIGLWFAAAEAKACDPALSFQRQQLFLQQQSQFGGIDPFLQRQLFLQQQSQAGFDPFLGARGFDPFLAGQVGGFYGGPLLGVQGGFGRGLGLGFFPGNRFYGRGAGRSFFPGRRF